MQVREERPERCEDCPLVEPLAWRPAFQAWHERAGAARELAGIVTDGRAKSLLILIAETYERLALLQKGIN
jgi:hypothetical protein